MKFRPHDYQKRCIDKIIETPFCGMFLDMGLGKTAITLSAISQLVSSRFEVAKVLVIAPKKVAEATWQAERDKWSNFKHLEISTIIGSAKRRERAALSPANIYVIGRDNVRWLVNFFTPARWPYDMLILDESTSFKSSKTVRFKALKRIRPRVSRVVELSGTPSPNKIEDLWSQIYLLDQGARLEKTFSGFRNRYMNPDKRIGHIVTSWEVKAGAEESITEAISDICISMKSEDYLDLPEAIVDDKMLKLAPEDQKKYDQLERDMILKTADQAMISVTSAAALSIKLLQLASGAVYDENKNIHKIHDSKIESFLELIEALNGEPVLVFYQFQHEKDRILEALKHSGLEVRVYETRQDLDDWNSKKINVLLTHPASTAYGLNLQKGGHHIIWFSVTWSYELYSQANKRLHRQGQEKPVIIHRLIAKDTRDEDVIQALEHKDQAQEYVLDSLKLRIEKVLNGKC